MALVARLYGCLGSITARQQRTLLLRTGLNGQPAYDPGQVARILHVSARREIQIEQAAVAGLRSANAHTSCATVSRPGSAIALVGNTSLSMIRQILQPLGSAATRPATSQVASAGGHARPGQRHGRSTPATPPVASAAPNRGVISPPHAGGMTWLLFAVAVALLLAVAAIVLRRRSLVALGVPAGAAAAGTTPAAGERRRTALPTPLLAWRTRVRRSRLRIPSVLRFSGRSRRSRPRLARLSAVVGGLMALPLLTGRRNGGPGDVPPASAVSDRGASPAIAGAPAARPAPVPGPEAQPADVPDAAAAFALATTLADKHDLVGAERAYRRADALGHPEAAFHLGGMHAESGDFQSAEGCYRRADELGHADGAFNLGVLLEHRNDRPGAEAAYRHADQRGSALAALNLGVLLEQRGEHAEAEAAYPRADEWGDAGAAATVGRLLAERGDLAGAEDAFRRADERGDAAAAFNLGGLLADRGDLDRSEAAFRRAAERGHAGGAFNLGVLLEERGELAGAEAAYRCAEQDGHGEVAEMARAALLELRDRR